VRFCSSRWTIPKKLKENDMFYTIAIILLVLWALGLLTGATTGGLIHLLLVIAIVMILANLLFRRKQA
jgi:fatty acid desaturase